MEAHQFNSAPEMGVPRPGTHHWPNHRNIPDNASSICGVTTKNSRYLNSSIETSSIPLRFSSPPIPNSSPSRSPSPGHYYFPYPPTSAHPMGVPRRPSPHVYDSSPSRHQHDLSVDGSSLLGSGTMPCFTPQREYKTFSRTPGGKVRGEQVRETRDVAIRLNFQDAQSPQIEKEARLGNSSLDIGVDSSFSKDSSNLILEALQKEKAFQFAPVIDPFVPLPPTVREKHCLPKSLPRQDSSGSLPVPNISDMCDRVSVRSTSSALHLLDCEDQPARAYTCGSVSSSSSAGLAIDTYETDEVYSLNLDQEVSDFHLGLESMQNKLPYPDVSRALQYSQGTYSPSPSYFAEDWYSEKPTKTEGRWSFGSSASDSTACSGYSSAHTVLSTPSLRRTSDQFLPTAPIKDCWHQVTSSRPVLETEARRRLDFELEQPKVSHDTIDPFEAAISGLTSLTFNDIELIQEAVKESNGSKMPVPMKVERQPYCKNSQDCPILLIKVEFSLSSSSVKSRSINGITRTSLYICPAITDNNSYLVDLKGKFIRMRMDQGSDIVKLKDVYGWCPPSLNHHDYLPFRRVHGEISQGEAVNNIVAKGERERESVDVIMSKLKCHSRVMDTFFPTNNGQIQVELQNDGGRILLITDNKEKIPKHQFELFKKDCTKGLISEGLLTNKGYFYNHNTGNTSSHSRGKKKKKFSPRPPPSTRPTLQGCASWRAQDAHSHGHAPQGRPGRVYMQSKSERYTKA